MRKSITIPNPELDLTSKYFDAEKALKERDETNVNIPVPNATVYDNISCFEETEEGLFPKEFRIPVTKDMKSDVPALTASISTNTRKQKEDTSIQRKSE